MPSGELPPTAVERLQEVGRWMAVNSEAIHDTMPQHPYAVTVESKATNCWRSADSIDDDDDASEATRGVSIVSEWRLTRKHAVVYALLLLAPGQKLPLCNSLALPFVTGIPGGVDGTWPEGALRSASILGSNEPVDFTFSAENGLTLDIKPGMQTKSPFVATFKLDFSQTS